MEAIANAGHSGKIDIGVDVAASEFFDVKTGKYNLS
jgi:enolase